MLSLLALGAVVGEKTPVRGSWAQRSRQHGNSPPQGHHVQEQLVTPWASGTDTQVCPVNFETLLHLRGLLSPQIS